MPCWDRTLPAFGGKWGSVTPGAGGRGPRVGHNALVSPRPVVAAWSWRRRQWGRRCETGVRNLVHATGRQRRCPGATPARAADVHGQTSEEAATHEGGLFVHVKPGGGERRVVAGMLQLFQRWRSGGTHQNHLDMAAASRFWCQYWASARRPFQPLVQHQGQAGQ